MRFFLASLALALVATVSQAQITLTTADLPTLGDTVRVLSDDSTQVLAPGPGGANQTWNFSNLQYTRNQLAQALDPAATPDAATFPTAEVALNLGDIFLYSSLSGGTDVMEHGVAGELNFGGVTINRPIVYNPPIIGLRLPATYQDTWSGSTTWNLYASGTDIGVTQVDSVRFKRMIDRTDVIDGWGTVILPNDTFPDVLRLKRTERTRDSLFAKLPILGWTNNLSAFGIPSVFVDSSFTYQFWANGRLLPVLQFEVDVNDTVGFTGITYQGTIPQTSGRREGQAIAGLTLYPNPAAGVATLQAQMPAGAVRVAVLDAQGRTAWAAHETHSGGTFYLQVPAEQLAPGLYVVQVQATGATQSLRLLRQ